MPWWAIVPVVSMITGPAALYILTRRKRRAEDAEERYEELSRRYTALLEESTRSGELPEGRGRRPDHR
ncbi:hypothetical protein [Streptomyces nodosus]|uniref:Uncharacterized protein n=1 Tax=Streptomyces nodosus TaxID=40318 RepID=A0A0B5DSF6_9ACTN|nr:hypothetical protein [Streptomyces nodosus]AJE44210.1 hypothetical protein SNOD_32635 [Streptomyces nodosus]MBB4795819.1 cytochrome c-type biogenesis protein CcmH/NrfF [Streptomyces nodosus]QEV42702.1 hypothetical protein CP978_32890 [Streptomyces nodosus]